jgi:hypothetical protein
MNNTKAAGAMREQSMEFSPACIAFTAMKNALVIF